VIHPTKVRTKFKVRIALPVPELMGGTQKLGRSLGSGMLRTVRKSVGEFLHAVHASIVTFPLSLRVPKEQATNGNKFIS